MNLAEYFTHLSRYHAWATERLLDAHLVSLSDEAWRRDCGLFFGSLHRTVNHLLLTDDLWWARFAEGRSPKLALDAELHVDRSRLVSALTCAVRRWADWVPTIDAARLDGALNYARGNGEVVCVPFAPTLGHVFNHATHHRGQISAALTAMGQSGPELDWVRLLQEQPASPPTSST